MVEGADQAWVQLGSARLHGPGGWSEVDSVPLEVDLLSLRDGKTATFRIVDPPPGTYDRIRLDVSDAWTISGGEKLALASSFYQPWIEIDYDLTVPECGPITIVISISIDWVDGRPIIRVFIDLVGGECDAGVADAAPADAALPDAAVPDAATPDAALPDAPLPDAAPVEDGQDVAEAALFRIDTDDTQLYGLSGGNVLAYGSGDGTLVAPDGTIVNGAFTDPGNRVTVWARTANPDIIAGANHDVLVALEATGTTLWSWIFTCCNSQRLPPAVDPATGQVYLATNQRVFQRDARTGNSRGASSSHGNFTGFIALAPGVVWKAGTQGVVTLYNRGAEMVGQQARFSMVVGSGPLRPPALASDGTAIIATGGDPFAAIDGPGLLTRITADRQVAWEIDARVVTAPVVGAGDVVFVGAEAAGGGYSVDAYSLAGASLWSVAVAQRPTDLVVADDGLVYVAAGGEILGLDQASGEQQVRFYGLSGTNQLLLQDGTLYVSDAGALYALPVAALGLDPAAPWPARFRDNQRSSSL